MMQPLPHHHGNVPLWMFTVSPGHAEGGIYDPYQYVTRRGGFRSVYERRGEPPVVDHEGFRRMQGTYRPTVVHLRVSNRPPLNDTTLPPRRTRRHWFDVLVARVLGLDAEVLP